MTGDIVVLRDEQGNEHRAVVGADGTVTIGEVAVQTELLAAGMVRFPGSDSGPAWAALAGGTWWVFLDGQSYAFEPGQSAGRARRRAAAHGSLTAPMPATVRSIAVKPGDAVRQGDVLVLLEAMKMELPVRAPADGIVKTVNCVNGQIVQTGQELVELEA